MMATYISTEAAEDLCQSLQAWTEIHRDACNLAEVGIRCSVSGADSMLAVRITVLNRDTTLLQNMSKAA